MLIIPDGVRAITEAQVDAKALGMALKSLQWDSTALMWGKVRQKKARHNLVFGTAPSKAASIAEGRGTRVCFADVPGLPALHSCLERFCTRGLEGEGNFYYDVNKCGIGFHCDSERTFTLACRFGSTMNIKWAAFNGAAYLEKMLERELPEGCIYVMNKLAAGRSTRGFHLRHAAGAECYAKIARKNVPGLRAQRKRRRGEADEERDDEA